VRAELKLRLGAGVARLAMGGLLGTCRFHERGTGPFRALVAAGRPVIFALWHGRLLGLTWRFRGNGFVPLISRSGDGEYIARVVERWGYEPVRGSTSRGGGEALREMVRRARAGSSLVLTPDGPRGPFQELKEGVLVAAQLTGCPIIPAASAASRGWYFGKWDRFLVPQPFAEVYVVFGEPIEVPRESDAQQLERKRAEVTAAINGVLAEADALARRA
jgi:lysophospholipid acyltransferase (LPLAT)-like uncharacterized protein